MQFVKLLRLAMLRLRLRLFCNLDLEPYNPACSVPVPSEKIAYPACTVHLDPASIFGFRTVLLLIDDPLRPPLNRNPAESPVQNRRMCSKP